VRELVLHDVTPAPDSSRLLVRVGLRAHAGVAEALDGLERARGFLRREVAAAITRKRAPDLLFVPVPTDAGGRAPGEVRP
jgi:ribosome-binding factor A